MTVKSMRRFVIHSTIQASAVLLIFAASAAHADDAGYAGARAALGRELRADGVADTRVLEIIGRTPRHEFVPTALRMLAYRNHPLPIGHDQTISQPFIVAAMTELGLAGRDGSRLRALEIGTGSGYQAAVLSQAVNVVYSIEIVPELAKTAAERLKRLGYRNVRVRTGDGYKGWPSKAPFDVILVTAAPPEIPQALVEQLAPRGRMVAPVGRIEDGQWLVVIDKSDTGAVRTQRVLPVRFVPMVPGDTG